MIMAIFCYIIKYTKIGICLHGWALVFRRRNHILLVLQNCIVKHIFTIVGPCFIKIRKELVFFLHVK